MSLGCKKMLFLQPTYFFKKLFKCFQKRNNRLLSTSCVIC